MQREQLVSDSVIRRLPRYYRFLSALEHSGIERISSRELAQRMGLTASQIRQDLNCFGGFGQQGYGYHVSMLRQQLEHILGLDLHIPAILVGAGNLGRVVANNISFADNGFCLIGIFDNDPAVCGTTIAGFPVQPMESVEMFCKELHPGAAVLCIPQEAAQEVAEQLVSLGIRGFWNYSHCDLAVDRTMIQVENVHLGDSLMRLSYRLHHDPHTQA